MTHVANPRKDFERFTSRALWESSTRSHYGAIIIVSDRTGMLYAVNPTKRLILGKFRDIPNTLTDIGILLLRPAVITRKIRMLLFQQVG
ncbi:MAG: hypothetical protein ACREAU_00050 [Nitrosopumilaceae archaeon]